MITTLALALPLAALPPSEVRVLVLGDSWAQGIATPLTELFEDAGLPGVCEYSSVPAGTAFGFLDPEILGQVTAAIAPHQKLEVVYLSLGGNDFLLKWDAAQDSEEATATIQGIADDLAAIVDHILAVAPEVTVLLPSYDYANFDETVTSLPGGLCDLMWTGGLASPTTLELNVAAENLDDRKQSLAQARDNVEHIDLFGVLQTHFGYPSLGIPPSAPGLPNALLPSPPEALAMEGQDCIHASEEGFRILAEYVWADAFKAPYGAQQMTEAFPGASGWFNTISASGFEPGSIVTLFGGFTSDLKSLHGCDGFDVGLKNPMVLDQALVDPSGTADFLVWIPSKMAGVTVWMQAIGTGQCASAAAQSMTVR